MPADYSTVTLPTQGNSNPSGSSQASSALSGAAKGASAGAMVGGVYGAVIGAVVGGVVGYFSTPKKPTYTPVDVNKLITNARSEYADNYKNSIGLEASANPTQAAARQANNQALLNASNQTSAGFQARNAGLTDLQSGTSGKLYNESSDALLQQLRQGGRLDPETQAAITRGALQSGGQSGLTGSVAGRGLVARDLGLTSLGLQQSRIQAAQAGSTLGLNREQVFQGAAGQDVSTAASIGQIMNSRQLPTSGLDPTYSTGLALLNVKGQADAATALLKQENGLRAQNVDNALSLGSTGYSAYTGKDQISYADFLKKYPNSPAATGQ